MYIIPSEYYRIQSIMPVLCVDIVLTHNNSCLLLKRLKQPAFGKWWFPGGRVLKGETLRAAAERKARLETGIDANFVNFVSVEETIFPRSGNMATDIHTVNVCFHMKADNVSNLNIDKDHGDFCWVDELDALNLNLDSAVLNPLLSVLRREYSSYKP